MDGTNAIFEFDNKDCLLNGSTGVKAGAKKTACPEEASWGDHINYFTCLESIGQSNNLWMKH